MITTEALHFISDLKANNNTEWMHANKKRYEAYKKDYHNFIAAILLEMKAFDKALEPLEVKNCTFRINRDIRFSKDKTPYKTHISVWLSTNKSIKNSPGYYLHLDDTESFAAGGMYCPEPAELKKIRKEIAFFYEDLNVVLENKNFKKEFKNLSQADALKRPPKDFDTNHPAIELLKLKSFTASVKVEKSDCLNANFAKIIAQKLILLQPLNQFLNRALETDE